MDRNFIIHQSATQYDWKGESFLSIKSFYNGKAHYRVGHRAYGVGDENFLLLNECTKYHLTIDHASPIESFCVFFDADYVIRVINEFHTNHDKLLDGQARRVGGLTIIERNYSHAGMVSKWLNWGRKNSMNDRTKLEIEEFYHGILSALIIEQAKLPTEFDQLKYTKSSTRKEIYTRVYFAKDYMDANFNSELRLSEIASVSMMSPNHFLRNFREIFGCSPSQYLSRKRLEEAYKRIVGTELPIKKIAHYVGYSSVNNFNTCFKKKFGHPPGYFRKR